MLILSYLSVIFLVVGTFFSVCAIVGLIRYYDFYIKLHTLSMFNIYGVSLILFSMGILTYKPIIFFEILFLIVINIISTLVIINVFFRNAILSGVPYVAKTRDDITQEDMLEAQERADLLLNTNRKISKESLHNRLSLKDRIKLEKERKKEEERIKKKQEKELKKKIKEEEKKKLKEKSKQEKSKKESKEEIKNKEIKKTNTKTLAGENKTTTPVVKKVEQKPVDQPKIKEQPKPQPKPKEEMSDIERENEELRQKIKEQKKILRKKIETVRRNAFITRKPEEIQKAEDLIKGILDKYHLTEEMLQDDYED